jgi:hypothetical protein
MHDFFRSRIIEEQRFQASRLPFRKKFFADECRFDSHADTLQRMESEKIVNVDEGETESKVVTEQNFHYLGHKKTIRLRYHLRAMSDDWLIQKVQTACFVCGGRRDANCPCCRGKQWLNAGQK